MTAPAPGPIGAHVPEELDAVALLRLLAVLNQAALAFVAWLLTRP